MNESVIEMKNWEKWQTFRKDRGTPPWIKLYRNLMSNQEWSMLTDAEKGQLVSMWIVAADRGGNLPNDPTIIKKLCLLDAEPNLNKFKELDFVYVNDAKMTPRCQPSGCQDGANMTHQSRAEESREEKIEKGSPSETSPESSIKENAKSLKNAEAFFEKYPEPALGYLDMALNKDFTEEEAKTIWEKFRLHHLANNSKNKNFYFAWQAWLTNEKKNPQKKNWEQIREDEYQAERKARLESPFL